jgi:hypothetical protein
MTNASLCQATDERVRALLDFYRCPVPFHQVRTRFLGYMVSPIMSVSTDTIVKDLWGGELPPLAGIDQYELYNALVMGLWNELTRHQHLSIPLRLLRIKIAPTRVGLEGLALMRCQELDGFIEGVLLRSEIFGQAKPIDLPKRAQRGLDHLRQMRALFEAVMVRDADAKEATGTGIKPGLKRIREIAKTAEREIHAVVMACATLPVAAIEPTLQ